MRAELQGERPPTEAESKRALKRLFFLALAAIPYVLYLAFLLSSESHPIDYRTFIQLGHSLLVGGPVYGENSYYPLPTVMLFAGLASLPEWLGLLVWFGLPVFLALAISGWSPWTLLFGPLFAHFVGGQASIFGLLALWGYRQHRDLASARGGFWLALGLLKPQLVIFPGLYALYQWLKQAHSGQGLPRQAVGFLAGAALIVLPAFWLSPGWLGEWLAAPRPLFERALAGILPRGLLALFSAHSAVYWLALAGLALLLLAGLRRWLAAGKGLKNWMLWSFMVNPLLHDYDLVQLIPLLDGRRERLLAALVSAPGWLVIFTQYDNDAAWLAFTFIVPAFLLVNRLWPSGHDSPNP